MTDFDKLIAGFLYLGFIYLAVKATLRLMLYSMERVPPCPNMACPHCLRLLQEENQEHYSAERACVEASPATQTQAPTAQPGQQI